MKRREQASERPDRWPWVRCTVEGLDGEWTFRIPTAGVGMHVVSAFEEARASGDLAKIEAANAALIGQCWADEVWELECDPADGDAVIQELHEAGWRMGHWFAMAQGLAKLIAEQVPEPEEIRRAVDFFAVRGAVASTRSTSPTPTLEAPSPGTP